jgi:predicted porin
MTPPTAHPLTSKLPLALPVLALLLAPATALAQQELQPGGFFDHTERVSSRQVDESALTFTPRLAELQLGFSYASEEGRQPLVFGSGPERQFTLEANVNDPASGLQLSLGGGTVGTDSDLNEASLFSLGVALNLEDFTFGGSFGQPLDSPSFGTAQGWDLGVAYDEGPWALSLSWWHGDGSGYDNPYGLEGGSRLGGAEEIDPDLDLVHLSGSYHLDPSLTVHGTFGYNTQEDDTAESTQDEAWYLIVGPSLKF